MKQLRNSCGLTNETPTRGAAARLTNETAGNSSGLANEIPMKGAAAGLTNETAGNSNGLANEIPMKGAAGAWLMKQLRTAVGWPMKHPHKAQLGG
jgi:hypothetical protein